MAIEKESTGMPEVDFGRRTTKVNLWMVVMVMAFFLVAGAVVLWLSHS